MLIALAVLAALETAAPPAVEMTLTGAGGPPVSMARRTLSDVARERREGRTAVGGFSAVETTVPREPFALPAFTWDEEETRPEPEAVPEPQPPASAVAYVPGYGGWTSGGWGGAPPRRRPPHVSHFARPTGDARAHGSGGASGRGSGAPRTGRGTLNSGPAALAPTVGTHGGFPRR
jgi:hypothetical protein